MTDEMKPISEIIKQRVIEAGDKYFSTDNISDHIKDGELDLLIDEVETKVDALLRSLIIDVDADHNSNGTPNRLAKMYINEIFSGRYYPEPNVTDFPNVTQYDQLYIVGPLEIKSFCSHHHMPITGTCYIGVFPGKNVVGLSKFARLTSWIAERPSIQEEMTSQIADKIEEITQGEGVAVVVSASHGCMTLRGVKTHDSKMLTSVMRGKFKTDPNLKTELFNLMNGMKSS